MRSFLFALCIMSLLFSGVASAYVKVNVAPKGKAAELAGKVKKGMMTFAVGVVALGAACGITGCGDQAKNIAKDIISNNGDVAVMGEPINIGVIYEADRFPESLRGAELAAAQINSAGGINGRPIVLLPRDNLGKGGATYDVTEDLILNGKVWGLIGPNIATLAEVSDELAQRYGVPMIATGASGIKGVTAAGDMVFLIAFADTFQGQVMARFASVGLGAKTAAVFYYDADVYSEGLADKFVQSFEGIGGNLVASVAYPPYNDAENAAARDNFIAQLTPQLNAVVASQPDVIFIPGYALDAGTVAKLLREAGATGILLGTDSWGSGDIVAVAGDAVNGSYSTDHFVAEGEGLSVSAKQFVADYSAEFNEQPNGFAALGYDAAMVMLEAMMRVDSDEFTRVAIRDEIAATTNYNGATSIESYDAERHPIKAVAIKRIENGEIIFFKIFNP